MGNCLKKQSAKEKLLQLDTKYADSANSANGSGSLYDASIYDMSFPANVQDTRTNKPRGPRKPATPRVTTYSA